MLAIQNRLLLAAALVLALSGCPKKAEEPTPPEVRPTPPVAEQQQEVTPDAGAPMAAPALDAGGAAEADAGPAAVTPARRAEIEACVDAYLARNKLDRYGKPEGTMYMGGTPLFDEATGTTIDRIDFVLRQQPAVRGECKISEAEVPASSGKALK